MKTTLNTLILWFTSSLILLITFPFDGFALGFSRPPYTVWKWTELGYRLGGPELMALKNGNLCIASRIYKPESAGTVIYITGKEGNILKKIELPSSGDTSYPGLVLFKNTVWMSYYSSHEGKTPIYLAKVKIRDLMGN